MKVVINGRGFDTDIATHHWLMTWRDNQGQQHEGHVYQSREGTFYFYGPTEDPYDPKWQTKNDVQEMLKLCQDYLTQEAQVEIAELAGIEWE